MNLGGDTIVGVIRTLSKMTISVIDIIMNAIDLMNHPSQCNQFGSPIIFIASFNCFSFSIAMNRTVLMQG